jgi:hypothetical protein
VSPVADGGGRAVAGLEDGERDAAFGEVGGGGQADGAGADDDDRVLVEVSAHESLLSGEKVR